MEIFLKLRWKALIWTLLHGSNGCVVLWLERVAKKGPRSTLLAILFGILVGSPSRQTLRWFLNEQNSQSWSSDQSYPCQEDKIYLGYFFRRTLVRRYSWSRLWWWYCRTSSSKFGPIYHRRRTAIQKILTILIVPVNIGIRDVVLNPLLGLN